MKRRAVNLLFSIFAFTALTEQVFADGTSAPIIEFCYEEADQLPYVGPRGMSGGPGILIEIIEQASKDAGLRARFTRRPWKRCLFNLKTGQSDGIFAVVWQGERDSWGEFPKHQNGELKREWRLWTSNYHVYSHKESSLRWEGKRFEGLNYGVSSPLGYVVSKRLMDMEAASTKSHSLVEGFGLLKLNRLDGFVIDELAGDAQASRVDGEKVLRKHPVPFYSSDWYLPLSHEFVARYPEHAEKFWRGLQRHRLKSGESLVKKYQKQ